MDSNTRLGWVEGGSGTMEYLVINASDQIVGAARTEDIAVSIAKRPTLVGPRPIYVFKRVATINDREAPSSGNHGYQQR